VLIFPSLLCRMSYNLDFPRSLQIVRLASALQRAVQRRFGNLEDLGKSNAIRDKGALQHLPNLGLQLNNLEAADADLSSKTE
jgi:hypothetical protein